jgi:NhaP-type Na+/H+ or K+/H+ antiporter/mannitol/fructose-specific phosphotransferase system IIA component (Ntr-type)
MDEHSKHALLNSIATAIAGGMFLTVLSRKISVSAIILLLFGGIALGPEGIGLVQPGSLGSFLPVVVSLAVGLILFEGGLTLDLRGFSRGSQAIPRLLSVGVLITWFGAALTFWLVLRADPGTAVLAGSLVIVTGPTVIGPLLKRIQIIPKLHAILHWEGVLIDAIGVFISILCFEWVVGRNGEKALAHFALRLISGFALGGLGGYGLIVAFRRRLIPDSNLNAFALAAAVFIFGVAENVMSESGVLAVTLAGLIVGWSQPGELTQIRKFKAEITDLLIGMLFVLLAARLKLAQFLEFGPQGVLVVAIVIFLVRPANVWISTFRSGVSVREKLFLSWVAPRGIVAASTASLFSIALAGEGLTNDARLLETFVYSVIVATVLLQGFTAGPVAKLLGLKRPDPTGWLIVNADPFGKALAEFIQQEAKLEVLLMDTNARLIANARAEGVPALCENALNVDLAEDRVEFQKAGHLLAVTDNSELNELLCHRWSDLFGRTAVYHWTAPRLQNGARRASTGTGEIVFPKMARPSVIAAELQNGEAMLEVVTAEGTAPEFEGIPLLIARNGTVIPISTSDDPSCAPKDKDRVLVLKREGAFLARSLEGVFDLRAETLIELYDQLIELIVQEHPAMSKERILKDIHGTNRIVPAILGHGVAIPHFYNRDLSRRVTVLARLKDGLQVPDEPEPLRLVFFVISPAGDPEGHLATLAEIARFCSDVHHRERLIQAASPEDALEYIRG